MKPEFSIELFDPPSGNVRGVVTASLMLGKKMKRIAHATLLVNRACDITLSIPESKQSIEDLARIADCLKVFEGHVAAALSARPAR